MNSKYLYFDIFIIKWTDNIEYLPSNKVVKT